MKGIQPFAGQFAQFIDEDTPGTYNPAGIVNILTCLKIDFQPDEAWDSFRPDGVSEDAWHARSKEWRIATAAVRWDYAQTPILLEMALGIGVPLVPAPTGAGEIGFALPAYGSRDIKIRTLEWGTPGNCERCTGCFITAISHNADRDAQNIDGQITFICRKPIAVGVPMTGQAPANAVLGVEAVNVSGNGVFSVKAGSSAAQNVTLSIGDTTAQTVTKFAAIGLTVAVAGVVAAGAGETHTLVNPNATTNATIYGSVVVNPSTSTPSTVQTAIRALGGSFALRSVSGTITAPLSGGVFVNNPTAAPTASAGPNFTGTTGTYKFAYSYYTAQGETALSPTASFTMTNGIGNNTQIIGNTAGNGPGDGILNRIYMETAPGSNVLRLVGSPSYGAPLQVTAAPSGSAALAPSANTTSNATTPGAVALTIAVPSNEGNVADIEATPGTGYVGTSTPPGGAAGNIAITVASPANTRVSITPNSGAGWSGAVTQAGTDGKIRIPKRVPMLPNHFGVRVAETRAGLATAPLAGGMKKISWSIDGLAEPVFFAQEGELSFQTHSDDPENRKTTWELLVSAGSNLFTTLLAKSGKSPSEPLWIELREVYETNLTVNKTQALVAVSAPRKRQAGGKILAYAFTLTPVLDDTPFNEDVASLITGGGASFYASIRNAV